MTQKSPIAVVGFSGIFPGARSLDQFWDNLINKREAASPVPPGRWVAPARHMVHGKKMPDKAYSAKACLVPDFKVDSAGLNIDNSLLDALDPLYHMVLHTGRTALEQCRLNDVDRKNIGVILAAIVLPTDGAARITREISGRAFSERLASFGDFAPEKRQTPLDRNDYLSAKVAGFPGALLAGALNLGAGAFTLDAACASSLYAVKLACDALHTRQADVMLAGGASRPDALFTQVGFSQLQALSPSGRCAPFDHRADGLVVGEGAGIIVLKRLEDALCHGDHICGLIRGIGLSNDMRGNLLAPDTEGQVRAMQQAYKNAGWQPDDVDHIECHGAGTPLGDTVEIHSLKELWKDIPGSPGRCPIGSVKSAIGHLLTGAGAAGIIKTLLGFHHKTLPPSLNFTRPAKNSPLHESPFRVQSIPEPWHRRDADTPRRAAVSAFGFGGINGHLLLEEWSKKSFPSASERDLSASSISVTSPAPAPDTPVAIIGMNTYFGGIKTLRDFQETVLKGDTSIGNRPESRWLGCDDLMDRKYGLGGLQGNFLEGFDLEFQNFHIPPREIPDILPQQLLMLHTAAGAMKDAGMPLTGKRPNMGAVVGIGFDFDTTVYHLRWRLYQQVRQWNQARGLPLTEKQVDEWLEDLMDDIAPPLTAVRTIGDLGSIVASRIAREFQLGGPSFSVSRDDASGLTALAIGIQALRQYEIDAALVGAVDIFCRAENIAGRHHLRGFSPSGRIRPFDAEADGALPGEGAAAVVMKRLEDAVRDGDRIYALVNGVGGASNASGKMDYPDETTLVRSMGRAIAHADIRADAVSYIETHGSGHPVEDEIERRALHEFFKTGKCTHGAGAVGSVKSVIGHTGAAGGLASVVKTALCLYTEIIPPVRGFHTPAAPWDEKRFHIPAFPQYWLKDRKNGPRNALVCAMTTDGGAMHVVMSEPEDGTCRQLQPAAASQMRQERKKPLGLSPHGLFTVSAPDKPGLMKRLEALGRFIRQHDNDNLSAEKIAGKWRRSSCENHHSGVFLALIIGECSRINHWISAAKNAVAKDKSLSVTGPEGVWYTPHPIGQKDRMAFVFPGSGNHYVGMGRDIGVFWPEILRDMNERTASLKSQMIPRCYVPHRTDWGPGWERSAYEQITSDPLHMIFGQVTYGGLTADLAARFNLRPDAVIGYSLGQSAGFFALGAWPDREQMLARMLATDLFTTRLAGPCDSARSVWNVPSEEDVDWCTAVVNRPGETVKKVLASHPHARLLIINTPDQCVIGGRRTDVKAAIAGLNCESVFLDGVVTVHCDAAKPAAADYRALHLFPVTPPADVAFYSCAHGRAMDVTTETAADSILKQALEGFDFTRTINQAYDDGIRVFIEMGPHASCTGMIRAILKDRPHLAASMSFRGENEYLSVLKCLGSLISNGISVDLSALYGDDAYPPSLAADASYGKGHTVTVAIGGKAPCPGLPGGISNTVFEPCEAGRQRGEIHPGPPVDNDASGDNFPASIYRDISAAVPEISSGAARAHETYLSLSSAIMENQARAFKLQNRLIETMMTAPDGAVDPSVFKAVEPELNVQTPQPKTGTPPAFSREMCMEFAVGSAAKVLGPDFAVVDTYAKRVRLPDEPLMLVDRILSVEGEKCSLGSGRIVTEHDVLPGAWYLDGGRAPVCISVEAGQADLFLCSYLGIDHHVRGKRAYRLLDATVEFHRRLPEPGDTIQYHIDIDRFVKQGDTYLFFFSFKGFIRDSLLITMTGGCAGFFTDEEVKNSGGILPTDKERDISPRDDRGEIFTPTRFSACSLSDEQVAFLRIGDAAACFGPDFAGIFISKNLRLPGGRMTLIDRVLHMDPAGGRYGRGIIRAETDIRPDDWFLTCHFMDDMVMPGTLMYECCSHTLRIFLQQTGWFTDHPAACYEPKTGIHAVLKCRGPVTPETRHVHYEVEIKEMGYGPEPYVIADADMYADGHYIVMFKDMSLKLSNTTEKDLRLFWQKHRGADTGPKRSRPETPRPETPLFGQKDLLEFALGNPAKAFGPKYAPFKRDRFIARLPNPPYLLMDRVVHCEPEPWVLKPDGWIEAQFDVSPDHWYFAADRSDVMPCAILMEIALQPCGWLAAYMGSALKSEKDLRFRNLDGNAVQHAQVYKAAGTLTTRARLKQVSIAGDMIIESFEFEVLNGDSPVYEGDTTFGFFTEKALAQQKGIRDADNRRHVPGDIAARGNFPVHLDKKPPFLPSAPNDGTIHGKQSPSLPAAALLMIDDIQAWLPDGGGKGLGHIRGTKAVDPDEWFFSAHFFQDPVCPGSLGIEAFVQLLKYIALDKWKGLTNFTRFEMMPGVPHKWSYRGQITPQNRIVAVEADVTQIADDPVPAIMADGFLMVDGMVIYEMKNFGIRVVNGNP